MPGFVPKSSRTGRNLAPINPDARLVLTERCNARGVVPSALHHFMNECLLEADKDGDEEGCGAVGLFKCTERDGLFGGDGLFDGDGIFD
jgi:hypothetical protein